MRAGLLGVRAAADAQRVVRSGEPQLGEERPGHRLVPVLARVDEDVVVPGAKGRLQRGRLDQLRSCPDDADEPHAAPAPHRPAVPPVSGRRLGVPAGRDAHAP